MNLFRNFFGNALQQFSDTFSGRFLNRLEHRGVVYLTDGFGGFCGFFYRGILAGEDMPHLLQLSRCDAFREGVTFTLDFHQ